VTEMQNQGAADTMPPKRRRFRADRSGGHAPIGRALVDERTAAAYIDMSPRWLRESRSNRRKGCDAPPFVRIGRAIKYRLSDLDEFVARRLQQAG
jgi:hypothetical protein